MRQDLGNDIGEVARRVQVQEDETLASRLAVADLQRQITEMQAAVSAPPPLLDPSYDRPVNYTVLCLNTPEEANKSAIVETVRGWIEGQRTEAEWALNGPELGTTWTLQF